MVVITMERAIVVAMDGDGGGYNYGGSRDTMVTVVMVVGKRRQPCTYVVLADYIALPCSQAYLSLMQNHEADREGIVTSSWKTEAEIQRICKTRFFCVLFKNCCVSYQYQMSDMTAMARSVQKERGSYRPEVPRRVSGNRI